MLDLTLVSMQEILLYVFVSTDEMWFCEKFYAAHARGSAIIQE